MAYLSDSDDEDNDFLDHKRVFAKPPEPVKEKKIPIEKLRDIGAGKSTVPNDDTQQTAGQKRKPARPKQIPTKPKKHKLSKREILLQQKREERRRDPQWIETQARKTVEEELSLDIVDKITDLEDIGWSCQSAKKGKKVEYYPAIISRNKAEASILLENTSKKKYKTIRIQYIGVAWGDNLKHQEIALSKWIPYPAGSESANEERLQNFLRTISKKGRVKNNMLDLKIEEFAIHKMWDKVKAQAKQRRLEKEKDLAEALESSGDSDPSGPSLPAVTVTQDSDNVDEKEEEEDMDESDDENLVSPGKKQKKQTALHVNDEIEYYDVMGTFGNPSSLRKAKIIGIQPNESYPLVLSNAIMPIPGTHTVRRLPDGCWQPINNFVLLQGGEQSITSSGSGLGNVMKQMRRVQSDIVRVRDEFWEKEYEKDNKRDGREEKKDKLGIIDNDDAPVRRSRRSSARVRRKTK